MENKELFRCIRIVKNTVQCYSNDIEDLGYILTESFIQLAQQKSLNEQMQMRLARASIGCMIGALVPEEYFESFMEDIGLLEDEIYNEVPIQEVPEEAEDEGPFRTVYIHEHTREEDSQG